MRGARAALLFLLLVSAIYGLLLFDRGWIPHDEGTIALSAERFLAGDVQHRDYDEAYTGGLTYLHALAFRGFGVRLLSLRFPLLIFFLLFVLAVWAIAHRSVGPWWAVLVTFAAAAWSVPNYFASLPSWYNLFFATFGSVALIRHVRTNHKRWLFVAGFCAGASILFKIVGVYYVAAVLLFLLYREQVLARARASSARTSTVLVFKAFIGTVLLAALLLLLRGGLTTMTVLNFVVPSAAIVVLIVAQEWRNRPGPAGVRIRSLISLVGPFLMGVLVPCIVFALRFALVGALPDLYRGVFLQPLKQIAVARMQFPPPGTLWFAVPYAILLVAPTATTVRRERLWLIGVLVISAACLVFGAVTPVYQAVWFSIRALPITVTLAGCALLATVSPTAISDYKRQELFLLICVTALVSLVQFPFAAPIYFCYVAPLAILATASLVSALPRPRWRLHVVVLAFYLIFALFFVNRRSVFDLGLRVAPYPAESPLSIERGGLLVPENDARVYESLVDQIVATRRGRWIYAGPDCPEVYFLSGSSNPTRSFFDFQGDLYGRGDDLMALLENKDIHVVVVNTQPAFSKRFPQRFLEDLRRRFPEEVRIGHFIVLWRQ